MKLTIKNMIFGTAGLCVLTYAILGYYVSTLGIEMSIHGHIATILGIVFTYGVGIGLMGLMFFSNRSGHDQQVQDSTIDANKPK